MTSSSNIWKDICELLDSYKNIFDSKIKQNDEYYRIHLPKMDDFLYFKLSETDNKITAEMGDFKEDIPISNSSDMIKPYILNILQRYRMIFMTKEFEKERTHIEHSNNHIKRPDYLDVIHNPYSFNTNHITYL